MMHKLSKEVSEGCSFWEHTPCFYGNEGVMVTFAFLGLFLQLFEFP